MPDPASQCFVSLALARTTLDTSVNSRPEIYVPSRMGDQPRSSPGLSRQQYGVLIAGGVAIGLGGYALWYIRRKVFCCSAHSDVAQGLAKALQA